MINLKTNTTVTVQDTKGQVVTGLSDLAVLKLPASSEIIATRDIPAALAYEFYFKDVYAITHYHYLVEGETRYRVVGVSKYDTPRGAHTEVQAEMKVGT